MGCNKESGRVRPEFLSLGASVLLLKRRERHESERESGAHHRRGSGHRQCDCTAIRWGWSENLYNGGIQTKLDKTVSALPSGSATTCAGDVSKAEDATHMVEATVKFGGRIDVLVNNTAIDPGGIVAKLDPKLWREVIEVNLTGPFLLTKAAIPFMIENGGGSILNIASLGGLRRLFGMPAYASSKAGLIMLTQQVAMDYGPYKVINNVVCAGWHQNSYDRTLTRRLEKNAQHRFGRCIQSHIIRSSPTPLCGTRRDHGHLQLPGK